MARTPDEPINGQMGSYNGNDTTGSTDAGNIIQATGQDVIDLPSSDFVANADITRDGQDLVLEAPDGSVIVIEGYFSAEPAPVLLSPEGQALTPQLVQSFVTQAGPMQYANTATLNDESPVGAVQELTGKATVTRTDGTTQEITIGTPIYQGDIIETDDEGAVNIVFVDETSFAVSENARLAIDEYVFDPATESGSQGFSILRGVFVFTSGLIGRDDPDDVNIDTPVGSIGIRGTTIMGNINPDGDSQITIVEGAIVVRNSTGEQTLATEFETITLSSYSSTMTNQGSLDSGAVNDSYGSLRTVSPDAFLAAEDTGSTEDTTMSDGDNTTESADSNTNTEESTEDTTATEEATAAESEDTQTVDSSTTTTEETTDTTETADSTDSTTDTSNPTDSNTLSLDTETSFDGTDNTFDGSATDGGTTTTSTSDGGTTTTSTSGSTASGGGSTSTSDSGETTSGSTTLPPLDIVINRTEIDNDLDTAPADVVAVVGTTYSFKDVTFQLLDAQINGISTADFVLVDGPDNKAAIKFAANGTNIFDTGDTLTFSVQATLPDGRTTTETYNVGVSELVGLGNMQITDFVTAAEGAGTIQENNAGEVAFDALIPIFGDDNPATEPVTWQLGSIVDANNTDFSALFEIVAHPSGDTNQARIKLKAGQSLDAEAVDGQLTFTVLSQLNATGELVTQTVTMNVADFDDTAPTLDVNAGATLNEGATTVLNTGMIDASDVDTTDPGIVFQLNNGPANGALQIWTGSVWANAGTGDTFTMQDINAGNVRYVHDGSETTADSFDFVLKDAAGNIDTTHTFNVTVNPVNEAPTITSGAGASVSIGELDADGTAVHALTATDPEGDALTYSITSGNTNGAFAIDGSGNITIADTTKIDFETQSTYTLGVKVDDGNGNFQTTNVTVNVTDVNEAPTVVSNTGTTLNEGATTTITSAMLSVGDQDTTATNLTYSITSPTNGQLELTTNPGTAITSFTQADLDAGKVVYVHDSSETTADSFDFTVTDDGGNITASQTFNITVNPVNDAPTIMAPTTTATIAETASNGITIAVVSASDPEGDPLSYSIVSGAPAGVFSISSGVLTVNDTSQLDFETQSSYTLGIQVDDGNGNTDTTSITVNLSDVNEAPTLDNNTGATVNEDATVAITNAMLSVSDQDTTATNLTYSIASPTNGQLELTTNPGTAITSFTQADLDAGKVVYVHDGSETTSDSFGFSVTDDASNIITSQTFNITVNPVNDAPSGGVTITGTAAEDQTLTADPSGLSDGDGLGAFSYQWEESNDGGTTWSVIGGATGSTYLLTDADVGNNIRVKVSYTDGGGTTENITSGQTTAVSNVNDAPTGSVTITGTVTEDQTLTADTSSLADADGLGAFSYQWESSNDGGTTWTNIGSATGATYTLGDADVDNNIRVKVSYTDGNGTTENITSGQTTVVSNINDAPTGGVTITGTATEDQTLTADTSGIGDADGLGAYSYQWEASNDGGITWTAVGTNNQNYVLNDGDVGQEIRVTVSYTDGNGTAESLTSTATAPVANINDAPTGSVTITGTEQEGSTLTADTSAIVDNDGLAGATFLYQWEMSNDGGTTWTNIGGATSQTFTPGNTEAGQILRVNVRYTDDNGTTENLTSAATGTITAVDDAPTLDTNDGIADALNFEEGDDIVIDQTMLSTSDPDTADTDIVYTLSTVPLYGDLYLNGVLLNSGDTFTQQDLIDGLLVFYHDGTANSDDTVGTADDAFQFDVTDGTTSLTGQTFEIDVKPASVPQLHALASRPDDGFVISGGTGSQLGTAVAALGNIDNLDSMGYEDFVIAQPGTGDDLIATEGGTAIGGPNTTLNGIGKMSLSGIGDFDGDGELDYIAGQADSDSNLGGTTAVVSTGNIQIINGSGTIMTEIVSGHNAGDQAGYSVAGIGDINGDGLSDIIYGAPGDDDTGTDAGAAYVFYGTGAVTNLDPANKDFPVVGNAGDRTGSSVSGMGDFNNDGYADFMVGSTGAGGGNTGKIEFYWGGTGIPNFWTDITGIGVDNPTDVPIFNMGDMNGDGISDIAYADTLNGSMHFLLGGSVPDKTVDFSVTASTAENLYIDSGGSIGDFNGDGYDDAVFAVRSTTDYVAEIFVLYGHAGLTGTIELTQAYMDDPLNGFVMDYDLSFLAGANDPYDFVFSSAGDVDGDGFEDLLIGTPDANGGDGEALVVYGRDDDAVAADGNQMHIANQTAGANVIANGGGQDLVGDSGINNLNDGGFANITMNGGAGNDILEIHDLDTINPNDRNDLNLASLDGGTGYDTLQFFGANDTLDFVGVGSEGLSGIDEFQLMEGGQTLKLGLDDVFRLLQESENNTLKITDGSGGTTSLVINDNDGTAESLNLNADMVNHSFTDGGLSGSYQVWNFGSYQLLIDTNIDAQTIA